MKSFSTRRSVVLQKFLLSIVALHATWLGETVGQETPSLSTNPAQNADSSSAAEPLPKPEGNNTLPAGHSVHGEAFNEGPRQAAYLMGGTGKVHLPISAKSPVVQLLFDQGLGQLHGFWYWEAERSFRQAAALDPDCAMAYWGMAMANVNNSERAVTFIREAAKRTSGISRRESLYIGALSAYYEDWDQARQNDEVKKPETATETTNQAARPATDEKSGKARGRRNRRNRGNDPKQAAEKKRKQEYVNQLETIRREFPEDLEAKAFLAYYRWNWRDDVPMEDREAVDALLGEVFKAEPMHPAHHYRIHLWDDPKPDRALASAALCGQSAPAIAHMWHMPGHIYSKLHRYQDASFQQEASARVDHAYMLRDRITPYRIHNYAHNNEWLIRNLIHIGRVRDAAQLAQNLIEVPRHPKLNLPTSGGSAAAHGRQRLFDVLTLYELWDEYIRLAPTAYLDPGDSDKEQVRHTRWLGAAHFAIGNRIQGGQQLAAIEERLAKLKNERDTAGKTAETKAREEKKTDADVQKARDDARKAFNERVKAMEKAVAHLRGMEAAAGGGYLMAVGLFEEAGDLSKPHLARAYLKAGNREKAEKLAREAVDAGKNEVYPLATYVEVLFELSQQTEGKPDQAKLAQAKQAFEQLRGRASGSDLAAPIFDRLADIGAAFGYTSEWRLPVSTADDVGLRPPLESLGPLLWQPPSAVAWTLLNAEEEAVSIYDYAGKPVVVIFYLGYGCLHCAEQLQAFAPLAEQFRQAGIELVAVSTDSVEDLRKSIEAYQGSGSGVQATGFPPRRASSVQGSDVDGGPANQEEPTETADSITEGGTSFPFALVSNSDLRLFKAYGCFDDFEQKPLHGTFLIDSDRKVRWQETGAEPFKDAAFLLQEAQRLLALPSR